MTTEARAWCRIIQVEGVSVLFYQDFNHDDDTYQINTLIKTDGAMVNVKVAKAEPFTQKEFNDYVGEKVARAAVQQACVFGFQPVTSDRPETGEAAC